MSRRARCLRKEWALGVSTRGCVRRAGGVPLSQRRRHPSCRGFAARVKARRPRLRPTVLSGSSGLAHLLSRPRPSIAGTSREILGETLYRRLWRPESSHPDPYSPLSAASAVCITGGSSKVRYSPCSSALRALASCPGEVGQALRRSKWLEFTSSFEEHTWEGRSDLRVRRSPHPQPPKPGSPRLPWNYVDKAGLEL